MPLLRQEGAPQGGVQVGGEEEHTHREAGDAGLPVLQEEGALEGGLQEADRRREEGCGGVGERGEEPAGESEEQYTVADAGGWWHWPGPSAYGKPEDDAGADCRGECPEGGVAELALPHFMTLYEFQENQKVDYEPILSLRNFTAEMGQISNYGD